MKQTTIEKLQKNPHYKELPNGVDPEEEENVKTYGVLPKVTPMIEKHPTQPKTRRHKKPIAKENLEVL